MRGQPGGPARRAGCVPQHHRAVARRLRVEGHASVVIAPEGVQRGQHQRVDRLAPVPGDSVRHRQPGDLMAEPNPRAVADQQAALEQLIQNRRQAASHRLQQSRLDPRPGQRRDIEYLARVAAQLRGPRQHRIARRRRYLLHPGLQHLGHVERVPAGQPVQFGRGQPAPDGQLPHGVRGQWRQADASRAPL